MLFKTGQMQESKDYLINFRGIVIHSTFPFYLINLKPRMSCRCVRPKAGLAHVFALLLPHTFTASENRDNSSGLLHPDVQVSRFAAGGPSTL